MYSKVKALRVNGQRRADRDISADPGAVGHLDMVICAGKRELTLYAPDCGSVRNLMLPILFDAVIIALSGPRMLLQGIERRGDQMNRESPSFVQEWSIEVMVDQPVPSSHRSNQPR